MTDANLAIWNQVKRTDPDKTKPFNNGTFKGTSVDFNYNAHRATHLFGPYGIGWWVEILKDELVKTGDPDAPETIHTLTVKVHYTYEAQRGEAVGIGHTRVSYKTRAYDDKPARWVVDSEYAKKSMTDAMAKALSLMGFSVDIHLGLYDNPQYVESVRREKQESKGEPNKSDNWSKKKTDKTPASAKKMTIWNGTAYETHAGEIKACQALTAHMQEAETQEAATKMWKKNDGFVKACKEVHRERLQALYQQEIDGYASQGAA